MRWSINKKLLSGIILALSLAYPFIIYFMGGRIPAAYIILGLISALIIRSAIQYRDQGASNVVMTVIIVAVISSLFLLDERLAVHLYPVIMSLSFVFLLGWSLLYPPSLIERFARIMEPNMDARGVEYTRKLTLVWLLFCFLNAGISFATIIINDSEIWLLYNGFISYVLMGVLMGGEYLFRCYYRTKGEKPS